MSAPRSPSFRVWVWPLFLLAGWCLVPARAGAEPPPRRGAAPADKPDYAVYRLRYLRAEEAARILREAFGSPTGGARVTFTFDDQTNSVLVSAGPAELTKVEALLQKLDAEGPAKGPGAPELRVFSLKHREPDAALEAALQMVVGRPEAGRFVVDRARRQVLVYGNRDTLDVVEALLIRLDEAPVEGKPQPAAADLEVRLFWVVSGPGRDDAGRAGDDFKEAAAELARLGIDKPRLAAQVSVTTTPDARFEMTGLASLDAPYRLAVTGGVSDKDAAGLEVNITVTRAPAGKDAGDVCRLRTRVTAPLDRPLVLGTVPVETLKSAFVVQVQRRKPAGPSTPPAKSGAFEFREAPWGQVFEWLSDRTGLPVVAPSRPAGTFTFVPPRPDKTYGVPEVVDVLNEALVAQKYLLIRREHSFLLVAADEKVDPDLVPRVRPEDLEQRGRTELVSLVVPLKRAPVEEIAPEVKKMLGPFGEVVVLKKGNLLTLQDTAGNLRRVYQVLQELEKGPQK